MSTPRPCGSQQAVARGKVSTRGSRLTDEASVERGTRAVVDKHGRIDILVNNAGITGGNGKLWELKPDVWRRVIDVNLVGPYLTCRAVVPEMLKNGWGRIVNVASIAGKEANPALHYSASRPRLIGRPNAGKGTGDRQSWSTASRPPPPRPKSSMEQSISISCCRRFR
jgi:3-oxoacyl-[acyl-carrier protein] reductase